MVSYLSYKDVGKDTNTVLKNVQMAPGIRKDWTKYQAEGGWVDGNRIRFRDGRAETIGGWVSESVQQYYNASNSLFTGVARAIIAWAALDSTKYLAVGTNAKVEILADGQIYDVTPARSGSPITFTHFDTIQYSSIVTFTYPAHGLVVGDYIAVVSQNESFQGILLKGGYKVLTVPTQNTFTIDAVTLATSTTQTQFNSDFNVDFDHGISLPSAFSSAFNSDFGGTPLSLVVNFLIPTGYVDNGNMTGFGGGTYGTPGLNGNGYGLPRAGIGGVNLQKWSFDNWGEDLIANPAGGTMYHWVKANGLTTVLQPISGAPANVNFTLVAEPARFLIAFGCNVEATGVFDPLNIRWATEETLTDWTITQYNTAGEYRLPSGNKIVGAIQTSHEIFVFTDTAVYGMTLIGDNDPTNSIFEFTLQGTNISCISPTCMMTLNGAVFWMGLDNFYMYNGQVTILPSTIGRYIFHQEGEGRYNVVQKEKVFCGINKEFDEIWWLYPRYDESECSHYVKLNYRDLANPVWDIGELDRTVWIDKGIYSYPQAVSAEGVLYSHENGLTDDGQPTNAYITSAYFDIDDGENLTFIDRIVPDITMEPNVAVQIMVWTKKFPMPENEFIEKGPYNFDSTDNKISLRARGRQVAIEFKAAATGSSFALGQIRVASEIDGER